MFCLFETWFNETYDINLFRFKGFQTLISTNGKTPRSMIKLVNLVHLNNQLDSKFPECVFSKNNCFKSLNMKHNFLDKIASGGFDNSM